MSSNRSSKRIVLLDPLGDILFSGESSLIASERTDVERCPETKRSAESGTFLAARPEPSVTEAVDPDAEIATPKRGPRAA